MVSIAQWWSGSDFNLYIKDEDLEMLGKEHALVVLNHKYDIDWLLGWILCQRVSLLAGSKVVAKSALKYIPVLGWSFWFAEYIFLKRVWEKDQKQLVTDLNNIFDYPKGLHYCIIIMCEGTRFTKEKYEASMQVAKEKGLPILKHHLLPRTKGFTLLASQIRGRIDYIYDLTLGVHNINGKKPTLKNVVDGVPVKYELFLRRIPVSSIPVEDEKQCADFVQKLYQEKDEIFDSFDKNGDFSKLDLPRHHVKRNGYDLIISIFWLIVVAVPSFYYLALLLIEGSWMIRITLIGFLLFVNLLTKLMMKSSDSKHGSKFGLSPKKD